MLAGDGLLNYAFETAVKAFRLAEDAQKLARVAKALEYLLKSRYLWNDWWSECRY